MLLEELCKIARCGGNCRLVVSYAGEDRYAVGISDGVTTAEVYRGTQPELEVKLREQLPQYPETIAREARERKEKEDAAALRRKTEQNPFISGLLDMFDGVLTDVHHLDKEKEEEEI